MRSLTTNAFNFPQFSFPELARCIIMLIRLQCYRVPIIIIIQQKTKISISRRSALTAKNRYETLQGMGRTSTEYRGARSGKEKRKTIQCAIVFRLPHSSYFGFVAQNGKRKTNRFPFFVIPIAVRKTENGSFFRFSHCIRYYENVFRFS